MVWIVEGIGDELFSLEDLKVNQSAGEIINY